MHPGAWVGLRQSQRTRSRMRWRFLPTHSARVGWGRQGAQSPRSHLEMRCWRNATHPAALAPNLARIDIDPVVRYSASRGLNTLHQDTNPIVAVSRQLTRPLLCLARKSSTIVSRKREVGVPIGRFELQAQGLTCFALKNVILRFVPGYSPSQHSSRTSLSKTGRRLSAFSHHSLLRFTCLQDSGI